MGEHRDHLWAIILAAGEGRRLSALTRDESGVSIPKQFCSFGRDTCMLRWALDRTSSLAPTERTLVVVARQHEPLWQRELADLAPENVIVQPENKGTAAGILLPLLEVARRDPEAVVMIVPSDHHVEDEDALALALDTAARVAGRRREDIVLLGIAPDVADGEYGYIVPSEEGDGVTSAVARFVEKPSPAVAAELVLEGALWNAFMMTASLSALLGLYESLPEVLDPFRGGAELSFVYRAVPSKDFSRDVLERSVERLRVLPVPACGWSDLGTPPRLRRFIDSMRASVGAA